VLASVALLGSLWLVLSNFSLVTGGSVAVSTVLAIVPVVGLLVGIARGQDVRDVADPDAAPELVGEPVG
jgi:hypothetical protein